jgi:hypothetical protein
MAERGKKCWKITDCWLLQESPSVYYRKKLDYQEACVKEPLNRPACMLTGLGLSRNLNRKITINA